MLKTYEGWKGNLHDYLEIGDQVDQELVDYFITVLPPATYNSRCIQMGEPYRTVNGKMTYITLKKTNEGWAFAGDCWKGQTEEPKNE